jgi:large subunit ribosomal protein L10
LDADRERTWDFGKGKRVTREEKQVFVEELHQKLLHSSNFILTDYRGLKVEEINHLRDELKKVSVEYRVVKNTFLKIAAEGTHLERLKDHFRGPTAIAIAQDDPVGPAKVFVNFIKDHPKLDLKIGIYDQKALDGDYIKNVVAKLPSREELIGKVLFLLNATIGQFIMVLQGMPMKLLGTLTAIKEQKERAEKAT